MQLLLIEDDEGLGIPMLQALEDEGHAVTWVRDGDEGLYHALEWEYDLVILDRMLPEMDGLQVLKNLRKRKPLPVLMLTALNTLDHRLEGLDGGADDYLGKPFELPELLSRIRALGRRGPHLLHDLCRVRDVAIDLTARRVRRHGVEVRLTHSEFHTVELLLRRRGRPVNRSILEDSMRSEQEYSSANSLEVHIHRIRKKLGRGFVLTRRGLGYEIPSE